MYNKLVDLFPKHQLFYLIGGFYFIVFSAISVVLADPVIGVQNDVASPTRIIGEKKTVIRDTFVTGMVSMKPFSCALDCIYRMLGRRHIVSPEYYV